MQERPYEALFDDLTVCLSQGDASALFGRLAGTFRMARNSSNYQVKAAVSTLQGLTVSIIGFGALFPLSGWPWTSAQRRNPLPAQARKREGARYPTGHPFC